jgi:hypothetical protein
MSFNHFKLNRALVASALVLGVLVTVGCKQPDLNCVSYHGYFAAKYELEDGDPASPCGALPGDVLGLQTYYADAGGRPDLAKATVAIRPTYVNDLIFHALDQGVADLSMDENTQSLGDFTSGKPSGSQDFCEIPDLSSTNISIPEVPEVLDDPETPDDDESYPLQPATTVGYTWSNFKTVVNAEDQGTQFSADMHFEQDGCEADYHVTAMYPLSECTTTADCEADGNINPLYATECSTALGLCVLADEPPSYL